MNNYYMTYRRILKVNLLFGKNANKKRKKQSKVQKPYLHSAKEFRIVILHAHMLAFWFPFSLNLLFFQIYLIQQSSSRIVMVFLKANTFVDTHYHEVEEKEKIIAAYHVQQSIA